MNADLPMWVTFSMGIWQNPLRTCDTLRPSFDDWTSERNTGRFSSFSLSSLEFRAQGPAVVSSPECSRHLTANHHKPTDVPVWTRASVPAAGACTRSQRRGFWSVSVCGLVYIWEHQEYWVGPKVHLVFFCKVALVALHCLLTSFETNFVRLYCDSHHISVH